MMNPSSENDARSLHGSALTRHWPGMALALAGEALARHGTHGMALALARAAVALARHDMALAGHGAALDALMWQECIVSYRVKHL